MSSNLQIKATFKPYDELLTVYGTDTSREIDGDFDAFLHEIADQECVLTNYNPLDKTFDAALIQDIPNNSTLIPEDHPSYQPTTRGQVIPAGRKRGYSQIMALDTVVPGSIVVNNGTEHIFCTGCGFKAAKLTPYYYEPKFTFGDLYDGDCQSTPTEVSSNKSGAVITFNACNERGDIFCPECLAYQKFEEVGTTL